MTTHRCSASGQSDCCAPDPAERAWVSQASVDSDARPELMRLFVESGCLGNVIGSKAWSLENVRQMRKSANLPAFDGYVEAVATLRSHKLQTWQLLCSDTITTQSTPSWGPASGASPITSRFAGLQCADALSGTGAVQRLHGRGAGCCMTGAGRFTVTYRFNHAAFRPSALTPEQLTEVGWACRKRWSSGASILRRAFDGQYEHGLRRCDSRSTVPTTRSSGGRRSRNRACAWACDDSRSGLRCWVGQHEDDADIRARIVGSVAMPGVVSVRFAREPDYFLGTTIMGDTCDVLIARHRSDGRWRALGWCAPDAGLR